MGSRAIGALVTGLFLLIVLLTVAAGGVVAALTGGDGSTSPPSPSALADIPADYLLTYQQAAATCPGLDWATLAAIGKIESDHGRSHLSGVHSGHNSAGAEGPMQFLPATFAHYDHPIPDGGARPATPYDPVDAIYAAARYLCASGARNNRDLHAAIYTYNHSERYVAAVLAQAAKYRADAGTSRPTTAVQKAIAYAKKQLGKPYIWGGNGNPGFDCSGLTHAAYAAAGITIPRTADTQFHAGPRLPANATLEPGDLVFYGNPHGFIHHVGLYLGNNQMEDAPTFGVPIRIEPYRHHGDDYAGARRISP